MEKKQEKNVSSSVGGDLSLRSFGGPQVLQREGWKILGHIIDQVSGTCLMSLFFCRYKSYRRRT